LPCAARSLSVKLQMDDGDPFLVAKERMLKRFGLKNDASATITRLGDTVTVPLDLLAFMRVKVCYGPRAASRRAAVGGT
jgi:hypothetical protein